MIDKEHIVSRRGVDSNWPSKDQAALAEARRKHDAGEVTMCQKREGRYILQFAIPTKGGPIKRTPYFSKKDYAC